MKGKLKQTNMANVFKLKVRMLSPGVATLKDLSTICSPLGHQWHHWGCRVSATAEAGRGSVLTQSELMKSSYWGDIFVALCEGGDSGDHNTWCKCVSNEDIGRKCIANYPSRDMKNSINALLWGRIPSGFVEYFLCCKTGREKPGGKSLDRMCLA